MARPPNYDRQYDFSGWQASHPKDPVPGSEVDRELDEIERTLEGVLGAVNAITRDDGHLADQSVHRETLDLNLQRVLTDKLDLGDAIGQAVTAAADAEAAEQEAAGSAAAAAGSATVAGNAATTATGASAAAAQSLAAIQTIPAGAVVRDTKANLDLVLGAEPNTLGIVTNDPNTALNYPTAFRKVGAGGTGAWVQSVDRLRPAEDTLVASVGFGDSIRFDRSNVYGGGTFQLYVPRALWVKKGAAPAANLAINPDSAELPGFVKVGLTPAQRNFVYFDRTTAAIVVVASVNGDMTLPATDTTRTVPIGTFNPAGAKVAWASPHRIVEVDPSERGVVTVTRPIVYSRADNKVLVPSFTFRTPAGAQTYTPANGQQFDEYPVSASTGNSILYWWDSRLQQLKTTAAGAEPYNIEIGGALLGRSYSNNFWSPYPHIGFGVPNNGRNVFAYGRTPSRAPKIQLPATAQIVPITEPNLVALGFTEGMTNTHPAAPVAQYGDTLPDVRWPQRFFARIYVQTGVDDDFGKPTIGFVKDVAFNSAANSVPLTLEKKLSNRAAIFSVSFMLPNPAAATNPNGPWSYFWIGVQGAAGTGGRYVVTGAQLAIGQGDVWWVERDDYPATQNVANRVAMLEVSQAVADPDIALLYGPDMWLIDGRPQALYPDNINATRTGGARPFTTTLVSLTSTTVDTDGDGRTDMPAVDAYAPESAGAAIPIDPARMSDNAYILARRYADSAGSPNQRYTRRGIKVHKAPAVAAPPAVRTLHMTGDSLTSPGTIKVYLKSKAAQIGITLNFVGSCQAALRVGNEGRGGWSFASKINGITLPAQPGQPAGLTRPLPVGQEAAYLLKPDDGGTGAADNKIIWNPYVRPAVAGDDPARVFNGFIYDFGWYLRRWAGTTLGALPVPDLVLLNLGTGDINLFDIPTAGQWITRGLDIVTGSMLAAGVKNIGIVFPTFPHSTRDTVWPEQAAAIRAFIKWQAARASPQIDLLPAWAHMSQDAGWVMDAVIDPDTGAAVETITDTVHYYDNLSRTQINEVHAAWIAAKVAGV